MFVAPRESVGETSMVKNKELAKEVDEKRENNRVLEESLVEVKIQLDAFVEATRRKEEQESKRGKKIAEEDIVPESDPILNEEPFLKDIKALGGIYLECVPIFSGKMEIDVVMDWIDGMENHFECEGYQRHKRLKFLS